MDKAATWLKESLAYEFSDEQLLRQALTHRSAAAKNNERLEFLGDAVLQMVISELLFRLHPEADEGTLSRLRSSLVKDTTLAELAISLRVGEHLLLGSGEKKSGGHRRASILADAMEAIFAAVFLDAGIGAASSVIEKTYAERLLRLPHEQELRDPKTRLQEYMQARKMTLPLYEVTEVSGKAHQQTFSVSCSVEEPPELANGQGTSRREAEQAAAAAMLERLIEAR